MSIISASSAVRNGLIFSYDADNPKSWKGKPTTNHCYGQNAAPNASYTSYVQTASGTWPVHHPDAIRGYNYQGGDITGYVNTGVTDYTNTYHAIWTYDRYLNKPVVTMRDVDGQWKAKSFGLNTGTTPTAMGLGYGDTYSISWLQWTDDIAKSANAGMYGANTSGSNNFHDGLSNSQGTSYNTKPYTWQRVYATFTVNAVRNLASGWSCYMYGHYIKRGTIKIADVQIETGYASKWIENGASSRSNTEALLDLTGNNTITANSLTYNSDGSFSFNGSSNYITVGSSSRWAFGANGTIDQWVYISGNSGSNNRFWCTWNNASGLDAYLNGSSYNVYLHGGIVGTTTTIPTGQWVNLTATYVGGVLSVYFNGVSQPLTGTTTGYNITQSTGLYIGEYAGGGNYYFNGKIPSTKVYNRGFSANDVLQNFNATRGRYGL